MGTKTMGPGGIAIRLRAGGLVALGVALVLACGVGSASAETVVPVEGPWSGTTSVGLPVHFAVEGGNVVGATFGFHWGECGDQTSHDPNTDPIDPEGHWSFAAPEGQTIEGTFVAPDRVEGRVATVERMLPGCPATHAGFVAIPGDVPPPTAPQIYAVQNVVTGYKERSPTWIFLGRGSSFILDTLRWQTFGKGVARATGEATIRRFKREWNPKASLKLSRPIPDGSGRDIYSLLRFTLRGPVPPHFPHAGWIKVSRHGVVATSPKSLRALSRRSRS
ncbi:MAG TPA: hypothetical protein VHS74_01875 [Solirubrobacterales bacterium]|nr:hypothetical protein [Solirubrobacterales bacterium]